MEDSSSQARRDTAQIASADISQITLRGQDAHIVSSQFSGLCDGGNHLFDIASHEAIVDKYQLISAIGGIHEGMEGFWLADSIDGWLREQESCVTSVLNRRQQGYTEEQTNEHANEGAREEREKGEGVGRERGR